MAPEAAPAKPKKGKKRKAPKAKAAVRRKADEPDSGLPEAEEINPGLLLADFVEDSSAAKASFKKKRLGKASRKKRPSGREAETAEADLDLNFEDGPEDGEAEASARLLGALASMSEEPETVETKRREAQPENEFHLPPMGAVTMEDLMAPLREESRFGREVKELKALAQRDALPEPASEAKRSREERSVQYQKTSKDVQKWFPQVHRMNRAEQVVLDKGTVELQSTTEIVDNFAPVDDFEKELEAATKAAGAEEEDLKGAKVLPMNPRVREEHQTRQVARLKALMLREQQTKKRVNKIKSKTYRRIHRKSEAKDREVLLERLELENPELAQQLKQDYERKHAEKRLLRARNARTKWAQTMQRFAKGDRNAQQEISKQAQKAHDDERALRRAIAGKDAKDSDSEHVDLSDDDEENGQESLTKTTLKKAKRLTVDEIRDLDVDGELPSSGLLGMKFMQQAIRQKRENAKKEALDVLKELEGFEKQTDPKDDYKDDDDDAEARGLEPGEEAAAVKKSFTQFTPEELQKAREEVDKMLEMDDNVTGFSAAEVAGPLTIHGVSAAESAKELPKRPADATGAFPDPPTPSAPSRAAPKAAEANPWEDENPWVSGAAQEEAEAPEAAEAAGKPSAKKRPPKRKRKAAKEAGDEAAARDPEAPLEAPAEDVWAALSAETAEANEQRELVRTAFVEGTQTEDFQAELEKEEQDKQEKENANSGDLPGWGSWAGEGAPKPRKPQMKAKAKPAAGKRPSHIGGPISIYEGNTEPGKYFADKLPYGYENPTQYGMELRMPSGPEWNVLPAHLQKIKPKFFSKVGAIVAPLQLVRHLPPESRKGVMDTWAASRQPKRLKAKI